MKIEAIGIIGADAAGTGLAEIALLKGLQVRIYDVFRDSLRVSASKIQWALAKSGKKELFANLETVQDLEKLGGADIIIEAAVTGLEERFALFKKLIPVVGQNCIVAAKGGVEPVSGFGWELPAPERFLGFNFILPIRKAKLVEIIRTEKTGDGALDCGMDFARSIGKTPVMVKDNPGAMVERLLRPFTLGGARLLEAGKGLPHEIDAAVKEIGGMAHGPLETADFMGIDHCIKAGNVIYEYLGHPERLASSGVETRLEQYGNVGKKSTAGYYLYEDGEIVGENPALPGIVKYLGIKNVSKEEIFAEIMRSVVEEAKLLASEVMASELDIETAAKLGIGWPKGPFGYLKDMEQLLSKKPERRSSEWD